MSLSRSWSSQLAAVLAASVLALSACGGDDGGDDESGGGPSSSPGEAVAGTDETADDVEPADSSSIDICSAVTAEEMGAVLGSTVTVEEIPGGGCNFSQEEDPRAPSVALNQTVLDEANGGFEGTRAGISAVVDGEVEDLSGVGDGAFIAIGPTLGGSADQGAGAVLLGDAVVQVTFLQAQEMPADEVEQLTTDVLTLVGSKG